MARDRVGKLIGVYDCWSCRMEVPVREKNEDAGGKISAPCPWCGFKHYADRGTEHFDNLRKQVRAVKGPIDAVTGAPLPEPRKAADQDKPADPPAQPATPTRRAPLFGGR